MQTSRTTRQPTLESVKQSFEFWRLNKAPKSQEPIPQTLWRLVRKISSQYTQGQIKKTLGLSSAQWQQHVGKLTSLPTPKEPRVDFLKLVPATPTKPQGSPRLGRADLATPPPTTKSKEHALLSIEITGENKEFRLHAYTESAMTMVLAQALRSLG